MTRHDRHQAFIVVCDDSHLVILIQWASFNYYRTVTGWDEIGIAQAIARQHGCSVIYRVKYKMNH